MTRDSSYLLLVEDNQDDADLTLLALRKQGLLNDVVVIPDGAEALDFLFSRGPHRDRPAAMPQLVLLDVNLPKVNGPEVLRQLRGDPRTKLIPVVMLTSSKEDRDVLESYSNGANSYVQKPVGFDAFVGAVSQLGLYWLVINQAPWPTHP